MAKLTRANFYETMMLGRKQGCDIYYAGSNDVRVRPGWYHFSDGMANYIATLSTEVALTEATMGTNAQWTFILGDKNGNITQATGTGAVSVRPSDTFYSWGEAADEATKFCHLRQGYYNAARTKRILGAVWRVSDTSFYIINQLNGSDEIGENSLGKWSRSSKKQTVQVTGQETTTTALSPFYYTISAVANLPIAFTALETYTIGTLASANASFAGYYGTLSTTQWQAILFSNGNGASVTVKGNIIGTWHA